MTDLAIQARKLAERTQEELWKPENFAKELPVLESAILDAMWEALEAAKRTTKTYEQAPAYHGYDGKTFWAAPERIADAIESLKRELGATK
jgi:hypothetical protein